MTATIKTVSLGEIRGKVEDGVVQYLGVKYATLKDRLSEAELINSREGDVLDATKDGPTAPSILAGCDIEQGAVQKTLPKKDLPQSELDCLHVNIAAPEGTTSDSKLPVFLFIHGGGFNIGANSWPQSDWKRLIQLSRSNNLPVVAVAPNYRLNVFGFVTSEELRSAGYKANNGLRDQRTAISWVRKHIRDFGGDPENITLAGMSAGGASVFYHLDADEPLFKRAISMSGTPMLTRPLPLAFHEQNYQKAISLLGLDNATLKERIKVLLESPAQELITKLGPPVFWAPAIDGDFIRNGTTFAKIADSTTPHPQGKAWSDDLLIGDAQHDSSIFAVIAPQLKNNAGPRFVNAVNTVLANYPHEAQEILKQYNVSSDLSDDDAFPRVLEFLNDICFFLPVLAYAKSWPGKAYVYHFNEPNPWEGPQKGQASHILDVAYFFQNYNDHLDGDQQAVAKAMAQDFLKFCHGLAPWPALGSQGASSYTARVYGPSSKKEISSVVSQEHEYGGKTLRREVIPKISQKVPLDELANVVDIYRLS